MRTGGLHAVALFGADANLLAVCEDVGRHNAMDKLVGPLLMANRLRASRTSVLVIGRASFKLVKKAAKAGFPMLAIDMAKAFGMMLVGFLRDGRFNVYSGNTAH